jgi:hypothetical protein
MNFDPTSSRAFSFHDTRPRRGIAVAVGVSVLLHALLLYGYRPHRPAPAPQDQAPRTLTVWLRAPAPTPTPALRPMPSAPLAEAPARRSEKPRKPVPGKEEKDKLAGQPAAIAPAAAPSGNIAIPAAPAVADPFAESAPARPAFDMEAARRVARSIATEKDPSKAGTPLAQLPEAPIANETRLARDIAGAKRGDCKDGVPGGLLAPLLLMMDKKDSGCKW